MPAAAVFHGSQKTAAGRPLIRIGSTGPTKQAHHVQACRTIPPWLELHTSCIELPEHGFCSQHGCTQVRQTTHAAAHSLHACSPAAGEARQRTYTASRFVQAGTQAPLFAQELLQAFLLAPPLRPGCLFLAPLPPFCSLVSFHRSSALVPFGWPILPLYRPLIRRALVCASRQGQGSVQGGDLRLQLAQLGPQALHRLPRLVALLCWQRMGSGL